MFWEIMYIKKQCKDTKTVEGMSVSLESRSVHNGAQILLLSCWHETVQPICVQQYIVSPALDE